MIAQLAFQEVVDAARLDATYLVESVLPSHQFFDQGDGTAFFDAINALKLFMWDEDPHIEVHELDAVPVKDFASWLLKTAQGVGGVAIFIKQMVSWQQATGIPLHAQQIRSMIHEFGHVRLTPRLLRSAAPLAGGGTATLTVPATEEEEEMAWVYALTFLGVVLGDYSVGSRRHRNCDDAPKLFL